MGDSVNIRYLQIEEVSVYADFFHRNLADLKGSVQREAGNR